MKRYVWTVLVVVLAVLGAAELAKAEGKVLVVTSYHEGYQWNDDICKGVQEALKGSGIVVEFFHMDTKRKPDVEWKKQAGEMAKQKVAEWKPDVVITCDDNAQAFFAKDYVNQPGAPQIVFNGVNAEPEAYGYPAKNVTGILERPHLIETIEMFRKVRPEAKALLMLTDDSETMTAVIQYAKTLKTPLPVSFVQVGTFPQWQEQVRAAEGKYDAIVVMNYHTIKPTAEAKESMPSKEVLAWTVANTKLPIIGLQAFNCEEGALLGIAESGIEHGYMAGTIAKQIIKEKKAAGDFPITTAKEGLIFVNLDTAAKMGIKIPYAVIKSAKLVVQPKDATASVDTK